MSIVETGRVSIPRIWCHLGWCDWGCGSLTSYIEIRVQGLGWGLTLESYRAARDGMEAGD